MTEITTSASHGIENGDILSVTVQDKRWWARLLCYIFTWGKWDSAIKKEYHTITSVTNTTITYSE